MVDINRGGRTSQLTNAGATAQNINITDLICEGPIKGLVDGVGSLYLDDVSVEDSKFSEFIPESFLNGTISFSGSAVGTVASNIDISSVEFDPASPRSIRLLYKQTTATLTSLTETNAKRDLVLEAVSGTPFDSSWETGSQLSGNAEARAVLSHSDMESSRAGVFRVTDGNTASFSTAGGSFPSTGTYTITIFYYISITGINSSTNEITLASAPNSGTYEFAIGQQQLIDDEGEGQANTASVVTRINKLNIDFRRGDLEQTVVSSVGGVGGSVAVTGSTSNISGPSELKIISSSLSSSLGIGIFDVNGLPNTDGSATFPGNPDTSIMASAATILPSSAFGLDTAVKIAEADEIGFTIKYPALQVINLNKGKKETAYAFYVMQIRFQQNGAFTAFKALFPNRGDYVKHFANTSAPISFDHQVNLDGYRNIVGPFEDFQVRIVRVTRHIGLPVRQSGTNENDPDKSKWQLSATASVESLRAVIKDNLIYPYSSIASVSFSSKQFDGIPKRSYLLQGKLVNVPNTYTPREYSNTGIAKYSGFWNGDFHSTPLYTDNPAWIFYDIVTNNRYGAGRWLKDTEIDKYALYRVARYCDELVDDGSEYNNQTPLVVGDFYKIKVTGAMNWSTVGASSNAVGTIFQATSTTLTTATAKACRVEPRFRANVFLTKATDAYKVFKDFATIFLGILYWQDSKVVAVQDAPQDPVYNFTKGNVINGAFSYESSGSRTRVNQVVVTWNDPTINYEPVPLVVEDRESIARTGRIISESAVAFGATSESQAIRYGRWKLWTAQNQTEVVSFKTSLAAHFVKPGDVINIQDADRFGVAYSGRTSSATSTTLTFDRSVPFNSGSTYELSTLVTAPAALNASDGSITINSVTYERGEKIDQAFVFNGSAYVLTNLDTEKRASNAFTDSSGSELIPTVWKPYSYIESHEITNPGSTVTTVTLANSATFDTTPSKHNIWALKETSGGLNVSGSEKMYKVLSITEESSNIFAISAVEYFDEKFTAIEQEYSLGVTPASVYIENEPVVIPRPINPRVVLATDASSPGEELRIEWDQPSSSIESIVRYEVLHNIDGVRNPFITKDTHAVFNNVPNGSATFKIRAISRQGNISSYTAIEYGVYDPYSENIPRMAGGIPKGAISTAQGKINSSNQFVFQATNTQVASVGNPFITYTITGAKNVANISAGEKYYLYLDTATPSLKLLEYEASAFSNLQFYRDVGSGNAALSTAWTSIGTVSVSANSNEVTGSGFNNNVQLRDVLNLSNSTSPSGGDGATVISIISDTKLLIDRTFSTAKSSITAYRSAFRPDYANDAIFAEITKTGSTISTDNFITLRTLSDDEDDTTETLDDGTIRVRDGGISVDKIAANSITADKIQANAISAREIDADSINANHIIAGQITASAIAAGAITSDKVTANSIVATLLNATKVQATDIQTTTLSSISANIGDITAGTLKGGNIPDANSAPAGSESGAFLNLTGGKMVFGNASKYVLFDGTNLELNGVVIDASSTISAPAPAQIIIKEDGTTEVSDASSLNFTNGLNVSVSGTEATINIDTGAVTNGATTIPTGDQVHDFVIAQGYTTNIGDITGVTAGDGLSGGGSSGGVSLAVDSTVVRTSGAQTINGNKTFGNNVTVAGNLTVNGTTTTINTQNVTIEDNIIIVNSAQSGTPASSVTAGLEVERGSSSNKRFVYAESGVGNSGNETSGWTFGSERVEAGTFFGTFVGDVTGTPSSLVGLTTDNLAEGTNNLYFTNARAIAAISTGVGIAKSGQSIFVDLSELTDMTSSVNRTQDELILLDNGADRRKLISEIGLSAFNNDLGFTSNAGDITGVTAGTGLTGGGSSGSVTLNVNTGAVSNGANTIPTGDQVHDFVTGQGFVTSSGVTSIVVNTAAGLDGGGTTITSTGTISLSLDLSELTDMTGAVDTSVDELILLDNGSERRKRFDEIFGSNAYSSTTIPTNNNQLTNGRGFTTNTGTVTSVSGGTGLSGTVTTSGSLNLTNTGVTAATYGSSTNIPQIAVDAQGRITSASNVGVSIPSGANDATITLSAGNGLTGGEDFTTDQASDETITFNVGAGDGISVTANAVAVDSTVLRAGTGSLINEIVNANVITADMIQANSIVATIITAEEITASHIATNTITANEISAGAITAEQLQISNNSAGSAGIFMDFNFGNSRIDIRDSSALRVRIGYLA